MNIYLAYISNRNLNHESQIILLMISNGEGWDYLIVKKLSALLRGILSKHDGDFYCLNCLLSFTTKSKLDSRKKVCENKDFCVVVVPSEDNKILEVNQHQKSDKLSSIIDADFEILIEKV